MTREQAQAICHAIGVDPQRTLAITLEMNGIEPPLAKVTMALDVPQMEEVVKLFQAFEWVEKSA